jgi:WD40 repeat protein
VTLSGHAEAVRSVAFSPDGRTLASASRDRTIQLRDIATGQEVRTLRGHASEVWGVAFGPDGRVMASAGWDHTVRLWDVATGGELRVLRGHSAKILAVAYAVDGRTVASAGVDRTVRTWDAATGGGLRVLRGHTDQVNGVAFSPDGRTLASAGSDRTVRLWDIATGHEVRMLRGHTAQVWGLAYSPDGRTLASASHDGTVALWDVVTGQGRLILRGHTARVLVVAYSPDGRTLASAGDDGTVRLWDAARGQELLSLHGHADSVSEVAFSPDGRTLAANSSDGTVRVWEASPLTPEARAIRQARIAVSSLFDQALPTAAVLDRLCRDASLGPAARAHALVMAQAYGESLLARQVQRRVEALYANPLFRPEVLAHLRADAALSEPVGMQALAVAELVMENPESLIEASRAVVRRADVEPAAYRLALKQAEAACRLIPDEADFLTTLGTARYRVGQFREAVAALERADRLHQEYWDGVSYPWDLAVLALAWHRSGEAEQARALLGRLREAMKSPQWARDGYSQVWLREAEVIELDLAFPADAFAPGP